ncbi:MAG: glycosyltransferase family 4 protein [Polyangiales bacterium]
MRLAFFHPKFTGVGGAENLIAAQAGYLRRQGHELRIVGHFDARARWQTTFPDAELQELDALPWQQFYVPKVTQLERRLPEVVRAFTGCDAVIAHNFPNSALLGRAAVSGVTRLWYCNEPNRKLHLEAANPNLAAHLATHPARSHVERFFVRRQRFQRATELLSGRAQLRAYDKQFTAQIEVLCANSEFTRDNLRRIYRRDDAHVVYPIVRFPERGRARQGIDRSRGLQVLTHSRLDTVKNIDHVLEGFALYRSRPEGRSAQLHVVGSGGQAKRLRALAKQLQLGDAIRFHGFLPLDELERVYDACDVFALTPLDEPFGMVFPEAAARGLLLIGSDHGGPNEILDGGALGWTCDPFSPAALADVLARVAATSDAELDDRRTRADAACRSRYGEATVGPLLARLAGASSSEPVARV